MRKLFLVVLVFVVLGFAPSARSEDADAASETSPPPKPAPLEVTYLDNEVTRIDTDPRTGEKYFVIRTAVEVAGVSNEWIGLDIEFLIDRDRPLLLPDGKPLIKRWNNLFVPSAPSPVRWTDCRLDLDFSELEAAENLPRRKTFAVSAMGVVWNYAAGRYDEGDNWPVRAILVLRTDAAGQISEMSSPKIGPFHLAQPGEQTLAVRRAVLAVRHLKFRPGVKAYVADHKGRGHVYVLELIETEIREELDVDVDLENAPRPPVEENEPQDEPKNDGVRIERRQFGSTAGSPCVLNAESGAETAEKQPFTPAIENIVTGEEIAQIRNSLHSQTQIWEPMSFGYAFEDIATPEAAEELVRMQHPGAMLIETREQYEELLVAFAQWGWQEGKEIRVAAPGNYGMETEAIENLGYRVRSLLVEPSDASGKHFGDIVHVEYYVTTDGRLGRTRTLCVRGPRNGDAGEAVAVAASKQRYDAAILAVTGEEAKPFRTVIVPTDHIESIKLPKGISANHFVPAEPAEPPADESEADEPEESGTQEESGETATDGDEGEEAQEESSEPARQRERTYRPSNSRPI